MQSLRMPFASFMFPLMGVCVKLAFELYSTSETALYRGIAGVVAMPGIAVILASGIAATLYNARNAKAIAARTKNPGTALVATEA